MGIGIVNPYGRTKYMMEQVLTDLSISDKEWQVILLRYFNPVGAHERYVLTPYVIYSGEIGESPNGIPNNLMPYIQQVVIGRRPFLSVFGNDYDTPDGTGVRDYIHIYDLAQGHLKALQYMFEKMEQGTEVFNLGTGHGYSVLEMLHAMEEAAGKEIPYKICPRREGDVAVCYADPSKAKRVLGWEAVKGIKEMCRDALNWQLKHPYGFDEPPKSE